MEFANQYRPTQWMIRPQEGQRRAELLVNQWRSANRRFVEVLDWQGKKALIRAAAAAIAGPLAEIATLREDLAAAPAKPKRAAAPK